MKEILITSSVLIGVVLVLRLVFAKKVRRTLIYAAWALVALRLLIPVQIGEVNFSVLTAAKPLTETVTEIEDLRIIGQNEREAEIQVTKDYIEQDSTVFTPEVQEYIQKYQEAGESAEEIATALVKTQGPQLYVPEVREQVQQQVEDQTDFVSIGQLATVVWLVGVAVMAVWFAAVNLCHSRFLRKHREKLDCDSPIPVYVSDKVGSPCLVGLLRPVIYLTPESAAKEETLRHVLIHELTHYRHGDHVWVLVRCICLCIYWFDPLVWVAAWFSRRDCELACDEGALKRLGEEARIAYGKTLLEVVSHASAPANLMQTATAMNETKKQLKERVNFIVKKPKWSIVAAIAMVLVCAIVTGCAVAGSDNESTDGSTATNPTGTPGPTDGTGSPEELVTVYCVSKVCYERHSEEEIVINTFFYDEDGNILTRRRAKGDRSHITENYKYDERGNRIEKPNDMGNRVTCTYDENDRLLTESWYQNGNDREIVYTYDSTGNLLKKECKTDGEVTLCYTMCYDAAGNCLHMIVDYTNNNYVPDESVYWEYDTNGNVLSKNIYYGDQLRNTITNTYDAAGRLATTQEVRDGAVVLEGTYAYDEKGNLIRVEHCSQGISVLDEPDATLHLTVYTFQYDERGNKIRATVTAEEGVVSVRTWTYDDQGNMLSESNGSSRTEWTYDAWGNVLTYQWYYGGSLVKTVTYSYVRFEVPLWRAEKIWQQQEKYLNGTGQYA